MDLVQGVLNLLVPLVGLILLLLLSPFLCFAGFCRWLLGFALSEKVRGKVVLIIGASSGIGEELAYEYAKRGAKLMLAARRADKLNGAAQQAQRFGAVDVRTVTADVSKQDDSKRMIDFTINAFGRIDHLVCNAGIDHYFKVEETQSPELMKKVFDTNFLGHAVYSTYYALPHLQKSRGKIVVTSSIGAWLNIPRMAAYNASKAALTSFFDSLRVELGSQISGITIAFPGLFQSEATTTGKFLTADGSDNMDLDVLLGPTPVPSTSYCAKSIISGALRGRRYVVVPAWYKVSLLFRVFAPELLDTLLSLVFIKEVQPGKPMTKAVMDAFPSLEKVAYPPGMQHKTE